MRNRRPNWRWSDYLLRASGILLDFLYGIFITPLDRRSSRKKHAKFRRDIQECYETLLDKYRGKIVPNPVPLSLNDVSAEIEFPDRTFFFLLWHGEFSVSIQQLGERIEIFFDKVAWDEEAIGVIRASAYFVERCWERIPDASYLELRAMRMERTL